MPTMPPLTAKVKPEDLRAIATLAGMGKGTATTEQSTHPGDPFTAADNEWLPCSATA